MYLKFLKFSSEPYKSMQQQLISKGFDNRLKDVHSGDCKVATRFVVQCSNIRNLTTHQEILKNFRRNHTDTQ